VVLIRPDRAAVAAGCREAYGCPLLAPRGLEVPGLAGEPFAPGAALPGGLQAVAPPPEPDGLPPGWPAVVALFHGPSEVGVLGGAVAGAPAGELSLPPDAPAPSEAAADLSARARGLRALLGLRLRSPGRVLVPEGDPVLRDGERALQDLVHAYDPLTCLLRPEELVWQAPWGTGTRFGRSMADCSRLLGLRVLDFDVTAVPPGRQSTILHRHDGYEEAFVVLAGEGELLTERGPVPIRTGDVLGFPPRYQMAHAFRNSGREELRLLALGAVAEPGEAVGLAEYPETGKQSQSAPGKYRRFYLPARLDVDYWERVEVD
jgi:uncharacterized cupin superfamily protein